MFEHLKATLWGEDSKGSTPASVALPAQDTKKRDIAIAGAFIGAIALLLAVAGYVISQMSSDRAYQKKWQDYDDCGWA